MKRELFPVYIALIKRTMNDLAEENSRWLPDPKNNCGYCAEKGIETNHEAVEFVSSLLDIATAEFMESEEFLNLLKEHRLIKEESEEE